MSNREIINRALLDIAIVRLEDGFSASPDGEFSTDAEGYAIALLAETPNLGEGCWGEEPEELRDLDRLDLVTSLASMVSPTLADRLLTHVERVLNEADALWYD